MAVARNLQKEQEALKTFGKSQGKMPSTAEDWKLLHQYAYGANLPDEFKDAQSEAAPSAGLTPITPPSTTGFNPEAGIGELAGQVEQAGADVQKFSSPTMATNILQEAIREKTGVAQAGIGESEIFKKAGISGYAPLAQSLNTRGDELAINQAAFQNIITGMAGNYRDMATAAKDRYDMAFNNYQLKKDELLESERDLREHAQAIEMAKIQFDIDKDLSKYNYDLEHQGETNISGISSVPMPQLNKLFGVGEAGGQCGDFTHTISDGVPAMGDYYEDKLKVATAQMPEVGYVMVTETNMPYGHAEVVLDYNPTTGDILTVGSNLEGRADDSGTVYTRTVNLNDFPKARFIPGKLKQFYQGMLKKVTPQETKLSTRAQAVFDNPMLINQYTATEKGKIIDEIAAAGYDPGDLVGKSLSDTAIKEISATQDALDGLNDLMTKIEANKEFIGPIKGLSAMNPWSEARKVQSDIDRIRQTVGKALEGGVLRKEDEEKYKKILATITDEPETAVYKINQLIADITSNMNNYVSNQGLSGRYIDGVLSRDTSNSQLSDEEAYQEYQEMLKNK